MTRILIISAGLFLSLGCNESPTPTPAPAPSDAATTLAVSSASAPAPNRDRARRERTPRGRGGATALIQKALRELELDDAQKKTLGDALAQQKKSDAERAARQELNQALAGGARAGALDEELVKSKVALVEEAITAQSTQLATALDTLHQTLSPAQRKAFLASLDGMPMWSDDEQAEGGRSRRLRSARGGSTIELARLMRGLNLSEEQRKKMKEATAEDDAQPRDREARMIEIKKTRQTLKDAFASDTFDAVALTSNKEVTARRMAAVHREVKAIRTLIGILDAEQREKLAAGLVGRGARQRLGGRPGGDDSGTTRSVRRNRPVTPSP